MYVYALIGVKLDNTRAHAPPPPGWRMTPETKTYKKAGRDHEGRRAAYMHNK